MARVIKGQVITAQEVQEGELTQLFTTPAAHAPHRRLYVTLDDGPVLLVFTGDWHIGTRWTDHPRLKRDLEQIAAHPWAYLVGIGDYKHNAKIGHGTQSALYENQQWGDPNFQDAAIRKLLLQHPEKWIGLVRGNHDAFDQRYGGVERLPDLVEETGAIYLGDGGPLDFQVDAQFYTGIFYHKFGAAKSGLVRLMNERAYLQPDFCVQGHYHFRELISRTYPGATHETTLLRSGTYMTYDPYAASLGCVGGEYGVPSVLLFGDRHKVIPFSGESLEEALWTCSQYHQHALAA